MSALPKYDELPLWVPRIESPAPVAPGSDSSEEAARVVEPFRAKSRGRMTEQGPLFDMAPRRQHAPYARNSETSKAAADRIAPKAHLQREQVYAYIASRKDATQKEVERGTGILRSSVCARTSELEREGRIRKAYALVDGKAAPIRRESCAAYEAGRSV